MSTSSPAPVGPYSPAVRAGGFLICSGQLGLKDGQLVDGIGPQVTQAMANLAALLETHDVPLTSVVKTLVLLADIADFSAMNEAYMAAFGDHRPARSAFAVGALPLGALVEIEAWAWTGG